VSQVQMCYFGTMTYQVPPEKGWSSFEGLAFCLPLVRVGPCLLCEFKLLLCRRLSGKAEGHRINCMGHEAI
jgi:hypothetical protein